MGEGGLFPLGGDEESSGYKGYGLMFMVEILCGILSGSRFGPNIRTWQTSSGEANLVRFEIFFFKVYLAEMFY